MQVCTTYVTINSLKLCKLKWNLDENTREEGNWPVSPPGLLHALNNCQQRKVEAKQNKYANKFNYLEMQSKTNNDIII